MLRKFLYCVSTLFLVGCATNNSWMRDNSRFIDNKPVGDLTLPGSHLANAYNITSSMQMCIGESAESQNMSENANLRKVMLTNNQYNQESFIEYLNTQQKDVKQQLNNGMRYLELQVCQQNNDIYTSNVYLTDKLSNILKQIKDFIDSNPEEIVIIDFDNNLWAEYGRMNPQDSTNLYNYTISIIGHNLAPKTMVKSTVSEFKSSNKRIILLSSNQQLVNFPYVWNKNQMVITTPAEYSTIKKIALIQSAYAQPDNANTINIVPLYSVIPTYNITSNISNTNNDDPVMFNYLSQTLMDHAMVIVTDYLHSNAVINLTIPNNQNVRQEK